MLVKIDDGFYLNSQCIIAVRIFKNPQHGFFRIVIEYMSNRFDGGHYQKILATQQEAYYYLQYLHQAIARRL